MSDAKEPKIVTFLRWGHKLLEAQVETPPQEVDEKKVRDLFVKGAYLLDLTSSQLNFVLEQITELCAQEYLHGNIPTGKAQWEMESKAVKQLLDDLADLHFQIQGSARPV